MIQCMLQLIDNYDSDQTAKDAMDKYDFHIFPVVNPDGYKFSHSDVSVNSNMFQYQSLSWNRFNHMCIGINGGTLNNLPSLSQ